MVKARNFNGLLNQDPFRLTRYKEFVLQKNKVWQTDSFKLKPKNYIFLLFFFYISAVQRNELNFCHKFKFYNPYIYKPDGCTPLTLRVVKIKGLRNKSFWQKLLFEILTGQK